MCDDFLRAFEDELCDDFLRAFDEICDECTRRSPSCGRRNVSDEIYDDLPTCVRRRNMSDEMCDDFAQRLCATISYMRRLPTCITDPRSEMFVVMVRRGWLSAVRCFSFL